MLRTILAIIGFVLINYIALAVIKNKKQAEKIFILKCFFIVI
jgi:hypothetical protein